MTFDVFDPNDFYWLYKLAMRYYTGRSEIARICSSSQMHSSQMSYLFSRSFRNSRQLSTHVNVVFSEAGKDFDEQSIIKSIEDVKFPVNTSNTSTSTAASSSSSSSASLLSSNDSNYREIEIMKANLILCIREIKFYNQVYRQLITLKSTAFEWTTQGHMRQLESLWSNLMPDIRRSKAPEITTNPVSSESWKDIGFQGCDPSTDFRGMGFLGLLQLEHFANKHTEKAKRCLQESVNPSRAYFPFAATGINFTFFLMELISEQRLYHFVFEKYELNALCATTDENDSNDETIVNMTLDSLHDLYSDLYIDFLDLWLTENPNSLMDFPRIFNQFKKDVRAKYCTLKY